MDNNNSKKKIPINLENYILKARQAADYIYIMQNSMVCKGICGRSRCRRMNVLMEHCSTCDDKKSCVVVGCNQSKLLLNHIKICSEVPKNDGSSSSSSKDDRKPCLICGFLNSFIRNDSGGNSVGSGCIFKRKVTVDEFVVPSSLPKRFRSDSSTSVWTNTSLGTILGDLLLLAHVCAKILFVLNNWFSACLSV